MRVWLQLLLVIYVVAAQNVLAQTSSEHTRALNRLKRLVGVIHANVGGAERDGTVMLISYAGSTLFVVTAGHVVFEGPRAASSIHVRLELCPEPIPAHVDRADYDNRLDLAILRVDLPTHCHAELSATELPGVALGVLDDAVLNVTGHRLIVLARDTDNDSRLFEAQLQSWNLPLFTIEATRINPSMSGGVVATEDGRVLGMLTHEGGLSTSINAIIAHMAKRKLAANLLGSFASLHVSGQPTQARLVIDGAPTVPVRDVHFLSAGTHHIRLEAPDYQPTNELALQLRPAESRTICANMAPPISELWRSTRTPLLIGTSVLLCGALASGIWALAADADFNDNPTRSGYDKVHTLNRATDILGVASLAGVLLYGAGSMFLNAGDRSQLVSDCR